MRTSSINPVAAGDLMMLILPASVLGFKFAV